MARLAPYSSGSATTDGEQVTFTVNGTSLGQGTLSAGVATLTTSALPLGTDAIAANFAGDANFTQSGGSTTVTVTSPGKQNAVVTLGNLSAVYDGTAHAATAVTVPAGLAVSITYNGSATAPVAAGSYSVVATVTDPNYTGSATGTLIVSKATAAVTLSNLSAVGNGQPHAAIATTVPAGLAWGDFILCCLEAQRSGRVSGNSLGGCLVHSIGSSRRGSSSVLSRWDATTGPGRSTACSV